MEEEKISSDDQKNGFIGSIIDLSSNESVVDLTAQIHQLPCCIKQNGPCSVSHYFKPKAIGVEVEGLDVEEAFFRGRKLQGVSVPIPEGYNGYVLGKKKKTGKRKTSGVSGENSNYWENCATFKSITYWNHDSFPSNNDAFLRCFHWFSVANALHKPVSVDDLAHTSTQGTGEVE